MQQLQNILGVTFINQKDYFKSDLDPDVRAFFERIFIQFDKELNHIAEIVYATNRDDLFVTIERTWVGILNNAIIKEFPEAATLQEFSVALGNKEYGRADFFVRMKEWQKDFLFEAKMYEEKGRVYDMNKLESEYQYVLEQAAGYYNAETQTYLEKTYLIAIFFGWMRNPDVIKKVKDYKKELNETTDFCALYHGINTGVWVYGRIVEAKEFKLTQKNNVMA